MLTPKLHLIVCDGAHMRRYPPKRSNRKATQLWREDIGTSVERMDYYTKLKLALNITMHVQSHAITTALNIKL